MKKYLIAIIFVLIAFNQQSCSVHRKASQSIKTSDSTALHKSATKNILSKTDSSNENIFSQFFHASNNSDLSIGDIKSTEEEITPSKTNLVFDVDSIKLKGDTAKTVGSDGSVIAVYQDKTSGKMLATVKQPGVKKKTLEVKNISLKTQQKIDTGNITKRNTKVSDLKQDSLSKQSDSNSVQKNKTNTNTQTDSKPSVMGLFAAFWWIPVTIIAIVILFLKGGSIWVWIKKLL